MVYAHNRERYRYLEAAGVYSKRCFSFGNHNLRAHGYIGSAISERAGDFSSLYLFGKMRKHRVVQIHNGNAVCPHRFPEPSLFLHDTLERLEPLEVGRVYIGYDRDSW